MFHKRSSQLVKITQIMKPLSLRGESLLFSNSLACLSYRIDAHRECSIVRAEGYVVLIAHSNSCWC